MKYFFFFFYFVSKLCMSWLKDHVTAISTIPFHRTVDRSVLMVYGFDYFRNIYFAVNDENNNARTHFGTLSNWHTQFPLLRLFHLIACCLCRHTAPICLAYHMSSNYKQFKEVFKNNSLVCIIMNFQLSYYFFFFCEWIAAWLFKCGKIDCWCGGKSWIAAIFTRLPSL